MNNVVKEIKLASCGVFHGEIDSVVSVQESKDMVEVLGKTNSNVRLTIYPNIDHNSWDLAYNDELIMWFLEQKK